MDPQPSVLHMVQSRHTGMLGSYTCSLSLNNKVVTYHPQTSGTCLGLSWFLMGYEAALAMPHMPWVSAALRAILKKPPSPQPAPLHHTHSHFRFQPWPGDHPNTTNTLSVNVISAGRNFANILISTGLACNTLAMTCQTDLCPFHIPHVTESAHVWCNESIKKGALAELNGKKPDSR